MQPRLNIAEMFSTFAYFYSDSGARWVTDSKLRRSIETRINNLSSFSEQILSLYWYQIWRESSNNLALKHLSAYLQEPCYFASIKIMTKFYSTQYKLADYFQMGMTGLNNICHRFNPAKNPNLKAYAVMAFHSFFTDILRQRHDTDICTNYALLRKTSTKVFVEALKSNGLTSEEIQRYQLARECFRMLYIQTQAGGNKLPEPSVELLLEIASLYNRERHQLAFAGQELDPKTLKQWLNQAAIYIRSYLYPKMHSLNILAPGSDSPTTWDLPDLESELPIEAVIENETIEEVEKINDFLLGALQQLDPNIKNMLYMYYKKEMTQGQIAESYGENQVWVSRRFKAARQKLLKELTLREQEIKKSQAQVNVCSTSNELIDRSDILEEWLRVHEWS